MLSIYTNVKIKGFQNIGLETPGITVFPGLDEKRIIMAKLGDSTVVPALAYDFLTLKTDLLGPVLWPSG